jgi:ABC-type Mn2+/Zn2+ transport system permease subunit
MNWLTEPFRHEFMQRALFGCALIGFTNGVLSAFIVLRRLALMADAMAHSLLPGVAVALILFGLAPGNLFFGALVAALLVGLGVQIISGSSRIKEDTSLGLLFACSFSLGLVLLSLSPAQVNVTHYLFGNILGLSDADLWITYLISFIVLPLLVVFQRPLLLMMFEPSVAASQGVLVRALNYMLMALLVLSIYLCSDSFAAMFWGGGILGMIGSCLGLLVSYWLNLPSGACIVLVLGVIFLLAYLLSPKYGVLSKFLRRRHLHEESLARWEERSAISTPAPNAAEEK